MQWYESRETDDADADNWGKDPYPPFPESLPKDTLLAGSATNSSATAEDVCSPQESGPSTQASMPAPSTSEIVTVDDTSSSRLLEIGIIIGRAKAHCCRDPNLRPIVRAILNSRGSVYVYMPHKYAKRVVAKVDVQISIKDVKFSKDFAKISSDEQRLVAIRHQLQAKLALKRQSKESSVLDLIPSRTQPRLGRSRTTATVLNDYLIVGRAKADVCRDPQNPPLVRAMVNAKDSVILFIPKEESLKSYALDRARISFEKVEWLEQLASMSVASRSKVIRGMIAEKVEEKGKAARQPKEKEDREQEERDEGIRLSMECI
jgi:hypothetical protein